MSFDAGAGMAVFFYRMHYDGKISPNLSDEQKRILVKRMSDLTLNEPFQFMGKNYAARFPELKPFVNVPISGYFVLAVMEGIMSDLSTAEDEAF